MYHLRRRGVDVSTTAEGSLVKILVTGATGFYGRALCRALLVAGAERVVLYSRSESRQAEVAEQLRGHDAARFFLGDVRDQPRLEEAMWGCDTVVHAAALKRVDAVAYDPGEVTKTNIMGSSCVTAAAIAAGVERVLMISSDKAVMPENAYGVSKAHMEREAVAKNAVAVPRGTRISCVRWGNVLGSTGSVVITWRRQLAAGEPITITDERMTRFIMRVGHAVGFTLDALHDMEGGEVFVPILPAARLIDLAQAVCDVAQPALTYRPGAPVRVGLRPGGEKRHEMLLSPEEATRAYRQHGGRRFVVLPSLHSWRAAWPWPTGAFKLDGPYTSDRPSVWLTVGDLVDMLREVP